MPPRARKSVETPIIIPGLENAGAISVVQTDEGETIGFQATHQELLDTPDKLNALLRDPHARFLPKTHREKNIAVSLLDYIDNPSHPDGVHAQLAEVYQKHINDALKAKRKRSEGALHGKLAVQSILYEYADYFLDAQARHEALGIFAQRVLECPNPNLSLKELIDEDYEGDGVGADAFVQYLDIAKVKNHESIEFDPLQSKEQRHPPVNGKNKVVHSLYDDLPTPELTEHINRVLSDITVGEARSKVAFALELEGNRMDFWLEVLDSRFYEYKHAARYALEFAGLREPEA